MSGKLTAIRGGKPKEMAQARILECACGCRNLLETRVGVAVNEAGKVIHKGTPVYRCMDCGKIVE